jgi:hypothetical protein
VHTLAVALVVLLLAACASTSPGGIEPGDVVVQHPFVDGERYHYRLLNDDAEVIATGTLTTRMAGDQLRLEQEYVEAPVEGREPTRDHSVITVDAQTLKPIEVTREITSVDEVDRYDAGYANGQLEVLLTRTGDEVETRERSLPVPEHAYDNESALWLWRAIDLREDYEGAYISMNIVETSRQTADLTVTGQETVTVPAGTFDAWRLQIRNGRATRIAWINVEAPHQIVRWDNGETVFELEAIE